jgi:hypothetical protein
VKEYHAIVDAISVATGENQLDTFKIGDHELERRVIGAQRMGYSGRPGHVNYSKDKRCDSNRFQSQIDALAHYIDSQGYRTAYKMEATKSSESNSIRIEVAKSAEAIRHASGQGPLILISHSSKDKALAEALIELLRSGLGLVANQIRCSSVDGYRLPAGVNTDEQLRSEINSVVVLIGLLTPNSVGSTYVLFELGARWGAGLFMVPLLAGIDAEEMKGPHRVLNALSCESDSQLFQLIEDIAGQLNLKAQNPASYLKQIKAVISLSDIQQTKTEDLDKMEPFGPHNYFYRNNKTDGPYCPKCWQKDGKKVLLPASDSYAGGKGKVCTVCNHFYVEERPAIRPAPKGLGQWS